MVQESAITQIGEACDGEAGQGNMNLELLNHPSKRLENF